jgi:hypothetical protein
VASRDCGATAAGRLRDPNGFGLAAGPLGSRGMVRRHCRTRDAWFRGRKSPRWSAEGRRPGRNGMRRVSPTRLSRLASVTRRPVRASRRSAHPSLGVGANERSIIRAQNAADNERGGREWRAQGHEQAATNRWRHIDDVAAKPGRSERRRLTARGGCRKVRAPPHKIRQVDLYTCGVTSCDGGRARGFLIWRAVPDLLY